MNMSGGLYNISSDDYKLSDSFEKIHSEIHFKKVALKDLLDNGSELVLEKQANLKTQIDKQYKKSEEDGQIFEQHDYYYGVEANRSLDEAFLLAGTSFLFSQFEDFLTTIAKRVQTLFDIDDSIEDYVYQCNKSTILCIRNYIQKFSEVDLVKLNVSWLEITQFRKIRNHIVHSNGKLPSNSKKLINYATSKAGLSYEQSENKIKVSKEYLIDLSNTCFDYLEHLMERIWARRPK